MNNWKHLPKFYGEVNTNKGLGFILELIKDYDGNVSKSFAYYLKREWGRSVSKKRVRRV